MSEVMALAMEFAAMAVRARRAEEQMVALQSRVKELEDEIAKAAVIPAEKKEE